jgi:DNA-binding MarR family transcriptional regulator
VVKEICEALHLTRSQAKRVIKALQLFVDEAEGV